MLFRCLEILKSIISDAMDLDLKDQKHMCGFLSTVPLPAGLIVLELIPNLLHKWCFPTQFHSHQAKPNQQAQYQIQ